MTSAGRSERRGHASAMAELRWKKREGAAACRVPIPLGLSPQVAARALEVRAASLDHGRAMRGAIGGTARPGDRRGRRRQGRHPLRAPPSGAGLDFPRVVRARVRFRRGGRRGLGRLRLRRLLRGSRTSPSSRRAGSVTRPGAPRSRVRSARCSRGLVALRRRAPARCCGARVDRALARSRVSHVGPLGLPGRARGPWQAVGALLGAQPRPPGQSGRSRSGIAPARST